MYNHSGPFKLRHNQQIKMLSTKTVDEKKLPHWIEGLQLKQQHTPLYRNLTDIVPMDNSFVHRSGDLQDFLMYIPFLLAKPEIGEQLSRLVGNLKFKKLEGLRDVESVLVLVLQTIIMAVEPSYKNELVDECLDKFGEGIEPASLMISRETLQASPFPPEMINLILQDRKFLLAIQLLKYKLSEENGWSANTECRDDNVASWIGSLFEPTIPQSARHLSKSESIPGIVVYDLLLRQPANELEYMTLFEIYCKWSEGVNLKDQERLYHLKQLENFEQETYKNRDLVIPPAFSNLFSYALRYKVETLPKLVQTFLDRNNTKSPQILEQISELIWQLSYDHSGKNTARPSRVYKMSQSKIIKVINRLISENDNFDIDVTTLLGVSNLTFYTNFRKSFTLFKEAKKRFDRWQLESFDIDGFEKIVATNSNGGIFPNSGTQSVEEARITRKDYNIKFLCNSILLLAVNSKNRDFVYRDFLNLLKRADIQLLECYPELWDFIMIKLNYHSMLNDSTCKELFSLYLEKYDGHPKNHAALDLIINNTNDPRLLLDIIQKLDFSEFDDLNLSRYISKLYKLAKMMSENQDSSSGKEFHLDKLSEEESGSFYSLIDHYAEVVKPSKAGKKDTLVRNLPEKFDALGFDNPIDLARHLYTSSPFKSSRLNSSYLLGESILTPAKTYDRYMRMNIFTKITPITISSLFVSALRLKEMALYDNTKWISGLEHPVGTDLKTEAEGESDEKVGFSAEPVDVALREFDEHVSKSYGDLTNGRIYPDDNLLVVYLTAIGEFRKKDRIYGFLDKMVDLRYPVKMGMFKLYESLLPAIDRSELVDCLNDYHKQFEMLRKCRSEYELKMVKKKLEPVAASGRFADFVSRFEFTWDIIRNWEWPGKF
ncbi:DEKNAAC105581 [Brettanomyces naardenensis]|uniref:DEKNAAC105581 n=1 Tax=Brettanomyces naardenensis TaxID=13370 RepID=A0A448YTX8_BRENA|nr:DEKNAAC105581 [Brettanomyces naardenensis]